MNPSPIEFRHCIEAARRGEEAALNDLCSQFYPAVRRQVHRALATDLRAKRPWLGALFSTGDVVQDVFMLAMRDLGSFEGETEGEFVSFLTTMTKNRLIDAVRFHEALRRDRRRVEPALSDRDVATLSSEPSADLISGEEIRRFWSAIEVLRPRERTLLRERVERSVPFEQLARELGYASADSARKSFCVAQAKVLTRLRRAGGGNG